MANPEWFTFKSTLVTYTRAFVEFDNWKNPKEAHEIHGIIELKKMRILTIENLCNLGAYRIIKYH